MQHRTLYWLAVIGIVLIFAQDAAAWPRRHHCRCISPVSKQALNVASTPTASAEVEQVVSQLRVHYPGKTDDEIIQVLRGYVSNDDSTEKDGVRWLAERLQRAKKQHDTVAVIERLGGYVTYDYEYDQGDKFIEGAEPQPTWLARLLGEDFVASVTDATVYNDAGIERVKELPRLRRLQIGKNPFTLGEFGTVENVRRHTVDVTKSDEYIRMAFQNNIITAAGLKQIKELRELRKLLLFSVPVSDASIEQLKRLTKLEHLRLPPNRDSVIERAEFTDDGVRRLQQALPNCKIMR